jgi:hypothetical protein
MDRAFFTGWGLFLAALPLILEKLQSQFGKAEEKT